MPHTPTSTDPVRLYLQDIGRVDLLTQEQELTLARLVQRREQLLRQGDPGKNEPGEGELDELAAKDPPMVRRLPRAPGAREARWAHLLSGEPDIPAASAHEIVSAGSDVSAGELAALKAEQARMAESLAELREQVAQMRRELGMA